MNSVALEIPKIDFTNSGKELLTAFVKFSADVGNVEKNLENPHFKSNYADLGAAMNACRKHLSTHNLCVMQHPFNLGDQIGVTTILMHESGQYLSSNFLLRPVRGDPQGIGSAVTYARRYSYMAILGIAAEDDDGNAASQKPQSQQQAQKQQPRQQTTYRKNEVQEQAKAQPPHTDFFDMQNQEHLDRLEKQLNQRQVAEDHHMAIALALHGKSMTSQTLNTAIQSIVKIGG